jgi:hypothetical protein
MKRKKMKKIMSLLLALLLSSNVAFGQQRNRMKPTSIEILLLMITAFEIGFVWAMSPEKHIAGKRFDPKSKKYVYYYD